MSVKIGIIVGSNRSSRTGRTIADWFFSQVKDTPDVEFEIIDLKEENLPFLDEPNPPMMGNYVNESTKKWAAKIDGYDGFVIVAAEYNHGYTAVLKNALDTLNAEWKRKPVSFVGYGVMGAARAIEQLVEVTAQLNMVPTPSTAVSISDIWAAVDEAGNVKPENMRGDVGKLVENLVWWTTTLKSARS